MLAVKLFELLAKERNQRQRLGHVIEQPQCVAVVLDLLVERVRQPLVHLRLALIRNRPPQCLRAHDLVGRGGRGQP